MAHVFIQKQLEEMNWLTQQLHQKAESLLTSDHPFLHLFLLSNLAHTTTKRCQQVQQALRQHVV